MQPVHLETYTQLGSNNSSSSELLAVLYQGQTLYGWTQQALIGSLSLLKAHTHYHLLISACSVTHNNNSYIYET